MKVLHFLLDGYHPSNKVKLFAESDMSKYISSEGLKNHEVITTVTDGSEHLRSPRMWFRHYSRQYVPAPTTTKSYSKTVMESNSNNLLWRKLAKKGVSSFCMPYNALTSCSTDWLLGDNHSERELMSGVYKNWGSKISWVLDKGKFKRVKTDYPFSALMVASDCRVTDEDLIKKLKVYDKSKTREELLDNFKSMYKSLTEYQLQLFKTKLDGNLVEFAERVVPGLEKFISDNQSKDQYIHIGSGETDALYHYSPYPEMVVSVSDPYIRKMIRSIVSVSNPDVVIISGDHNMVNLDETEEYKKSYATDKVYKSARLGSHVNLEELSGMKEPKWLGDTSHVTVSRALSNQLPIFLDHGYMVGGSVFYKSTKDAKNFVSLLKGKVDESNKLNPIKKDTDDLFPEYLYDTILESLGK